MANPFSRLTSLGGKKPTNINLTQDVNGSNTSGINLTPDLGGSHTSGVSTAPDVLGGSNEHVGIGVDLHGGSSSHPHDAADVLGGSSIDLTAPDLNNVGNQLSKTATPPKGDGKSGKKIPFINAAGLVPGGIAPLGVPGGNSAGGDPSSGSGGKVEPPLKPSSGGRTLPPADDFFTSDPLAGIAGDKGDNVPIIVKPKPDDIARLNGGAKGGKDTVLNPVTGRPSADGGKTVNVPGVGAGTVLNPATGRPDTGDNTQHVPGVGTGVILQPADGTEHIPGVGTGTILHPGGGGKVVNPGEGGVVLDPKTGEPDKPVTENDKEEKSGKKAGAGGVGLAVAAAAGLAGGLASGTGSSGTPPPSNDNSKSKKPKASPDPHQASPLAPPPPATPPAVSGQSDTQAPTPHDAAHLASQQKDVTWLGVSGVTKNTFTDGYTDYVKAGKVLGNEPPAEGAPKATGASTPKAEEPGLGLPSTVSGSYAFKMATEEPVKKPTASDSGENNSTQLSPPPPVSQDNGPAQTNTSSSYAESPPAYKGGAAVVEVTHPRPGVTLTKTATGAVIEQVEGHTAYRVSGPTLSPPPAVSSPLSPPPPVGPIPSPAATTPSSEATPGDWTPAAVSVDDNSNLQPPPPVFNTPDSQPDPQPIQDSPPPAMTDNSSDNQPLAPPPPVPETNYQATKNAIEDRITLPEPTRNDTPPVGFNPWSEKAHNNLH